MRAARVEYRGGRLLERGAPRDPLALFARWLARAVRVESFEPTAMALATADARGRPSVRMVLLRGAGPGGFTFFTHYASRKARELARRRAALLLYWPRDHRQVRIEGRVARVGAAESDVYFAQRPRGAQLGAWASDQSRAIATRATLERRWRSAAAAHAGRDVPRPPHWGGYRLTADAIEFWQGRPDRLHDRLLYTRTARGWRRVRLAP